MISHLLFEIFISIFIDICDKFVYIIRNTLFVCGHLNLINSPYDYSNSYKYKTIIVFQYVLIIQKWNIKKYSSIFSSDIKYFEKFINQFRVFYYIHLSNMLQNSWSLKLSQPTKYITSALLPNPSFVFQGYSNQLLAYYKNQNITLPVRK